MMNKKEFLILIATTVFVIFIWIVADIYHTKAIVAVDPALEQALQPIVPNFDQETLNQVKNLKPPILTASSTPEPTTAPLAKINSTTSTSSAQPTSSPEQNQPTQ